MQRTRLLLLGHFSQYLRFTAVFYCFINLSTSPFHLKSVLPFLFPSFRRPGQYSLRPSFNLPRVTRYYYYCYYYCYCFRRIHIFTISAHQILRVLLSFRPSVRLRDRNSYCKYFREFRYLGGGFLSKKSNSVKIGHKFRAFYMTTKIHFIAFGATNSLQVHFCATLHSFIRLTTTETCR